MATKTTTASPRKKATKKKVTKKAGARTTAGGAKAVARKKKATKAPAPRKRKASASSAVATPPAARKPRKPASERAVFLPRAVTSVDDDDPLMAHGGGGGGFGRCGGRLLSNRLEQQLCNRLGIAGVVHSHSPRHYEIRYGDGKVAAYAPMIVLRGRGREGKGVVIEAVEDPKAPILKKIVAFREQYGQEFYIIVVASDDVLDELPLA
ncbi:MAG TPA: hypothetical protein ENI87_13545, partial [bacterium]|nr:hypothetical protein [bacterium]